MQTLFDAAPGPYRVIRITDEWSERRLVDLKVGPGGLIEKLEPEEERAPALRIKTRERSGVVGGGMGLDIWVRCGDEVVTLASLPRGATGVVTALSGGEALLETARMLGIREGEEIQLVHRLPPMDYLVEIPGEGKKRLGEGEASKVWGRRRGAEGGQEGDLVQLTSLGAGQVLLVERLAAGRRALGRLEGLGIRPGVDVVVTGVEPRQSIRMGRGKVVRIRNRFGIELWLSERWASCILVEGEEKQIHHKEVIGHGKDGRKK